MNDVCVVYLFVLTAIAIAMDDSVTVSMGEEMRGVFRVIFLVSAEVKSFQTRCIWEQKCQPHSELHLNKNYDRFNE